MHQASQGFIRGGRALAKWLVPLAMLAGGLPDAVAQAGPVSAGASTAGGAGLHTRGGYGPRVYSVINLGGDEAWDGFLNQKGQVAISGPVINRFFDGVRLHRLGSLGGGYTLVQGVNDRGVVVGESENATVPLTSILGFYWTVAHGMHALPGESVASARAINDRNQIVGWTSAPGISERALRWDPNGHVVPLGPLPLSLSEAFAINNRGESGGFTDVAGGAIHATKWSASGALTDLGTLPGTDLAFTYFVNGRGDAAGTSGDKVFFWCPCGGMIDTGGHGNEGIGQIVALNERSEIAGNTELAAGSAAFLWSRAHGLALLPGAAPGADFVWGMNNRTQLVGSIGPNGSERGVRWNGLSAPIDLNTRLHHPPPGLVLISGMSINDEGDIVAYSNAGLVLLRPGARGTDAPVLGPVLGAPRVVRLGDEQQFTLAFVDHDRRQTHSVSISWDDGCDANAPYPQLQEADGQGEIKFQHRFCRVGTAGATIRVADSAGKATELVKQVYVDDPAVTTLSANGMLGNARAGGQARPMRFALWLPLGSRAGLGVAARAPGAALFRLSGPFQFKAEQVNSAVRSGQTVYAEGTGQLNGRAGYRFQLDAATGEAGGAGRLGVRISHTNPSGAEVVDYDNLSAPKAAAAVAATADHTRVAQGWVNLSN